MIDLKLGTDSAGIGFGEGFLGVGPFGDFHNYYHDIQLNNGDLDLVADGLECVQSAKISIMFIQGDWFLNPLAGLPWFSEMFSTSVSFSKKRSLIKEAILDVIGVIQLQKFSFGLNEEKQAEIAFTVSTKYDSNQSGVIVL